MSVRLAPLLSLLTCLVPHVARADTATANERETARAMMDSGHEERDAGHHARALALFEGADAIMHVPTTGLEVARELVALGQLVEARDKLQAVLRIPATEDEPTAFRIARADTMALDHVLSERVPALQIAIVGVVSPGGSLVSSGGLPTRVTVDATPIPLQALVAPFRVNPGRHVVTATAEGREVRREVVVAEGQTAPVVLAVRSLEPAQPAPEEPASVLPAVRGRSTAAASMFWGGIGLAAVGVAVGTATGIIAINARNGAESGCVADRCPPSSWGDVNQARTASTVSTVAFSVAVAGAALAVIVTLVRHRGSAGGVSTRRSNIRDFGQFWLDRPNPRPER